MNTLEKLFYIFISITAVCMLYSIIFAIISIMLGMRNMLDVGAIMAAFSILFLIISAIFGFLSSKT